MLHYLLNNVEILYEPIKTKRRHITLAKSLSRSAAGRRGYGICILWRVRLCNTLHVYMHILSYIALEVNIRAEPTKQLPHAALWDLHYYL